MNRIVWKKKKKIRIIIIEDFFVVVRFFLFVFEPDSSNSSGTPIMHYHRVIMKIFHPKSENGAISPKVG